MNKKMKLSARLVSMLLIAVMLIPALVACGGADEGVDYVSELKLDMTSETIKQEVTVKTYIDGDTTHFHVPESVSSDGVLKARYLAIDTPESTGKIEVWGKRASTFTKTKLKSAESIIVESDTATWNDDSTGSRYLVWVWYRTSAEEDYRNLNLEILQNGLAIASNTAGNRYGDICIKALRQAEAKKLFVHSTDTDPDFFYGQAIPIDMKELRTNIESYLDSKVAVEGTVVCDSGSSGIYVENYDEETGRNYGIYVYYGFNLPGSALEILKAGNRVRIVGNVTEFEGSYQISGLSYNARKPDDPNNLKKLGDGETPSYTELTATDFATGKATVTVGGEDGEKKEFDLSELLLATSVSMKGLVVTSTYTTENDKDSNGAITLTCKVGDITVDVRTVPLYENGVLVTADRFEGKTIDVRGVVDIFNGDYQIKVFSVDNIVIH